MNVLRKVRFPLPIGGLLRALSEVGFFDRSSLIGSWVMPIYQELYGVGYLLRTLDVDFAVHLAHPQKQMRLTFLLENVSIRFPIPEAFFVHKVIVAPKRLTVEKREKDLEQCTALIPVLNDERLRQVAKSQRFGKETRRRISQSCKAIGFPLQRFGFE